MCFFNEVAFKKLIFKPCENFEGLSFSCHLVEFLLRQLVSVLVCKCKEGGIIEIAFNLGPIVLILSDSVNGVKSDSFFIIWDLKLSAQRTRNLPLQCQKYLEPMVLAVSFIDIYNKRSDVKSTSFIKILLFGRALASSEFNKFKSMFLVEK